MTRFTRTAAAALTALTLSTALLTSGAEARPRWHGHGGAVAAGVIGAMALGGLFAASRSAYAEPVYVEDAPVRRCEWVERYNRYGEVIGQRRVCSID